MARSYRRTPPEGPLPEQHTDYSHQMGDVSGPPAANVVNPIMAPAPGIRPTPKPVVIEAPKPGLRTGR